MMAAHTPPKLQELQAPAPLANLKGWLIWRFIQRPGETKARKVPYYASGTKRHGVQGRPEDREQLVTFAEARAAAIARGFHGVGFAPMPEWKVTALDFDGCVDERGRVDPRVEDLVAGTYAEYSPSGRGVRAFVAGGLGNHKSLASEDFGFETFSSKGFVTFTGNTLSVCQQFETEHTISEASAAVRQLVAERFGREREADDAPTNAPLGVRRELIEEALDVLPDNLSYDQWLQVGMAIHHELSGDGFELWDNWSARSPKYSSSEYGEARWASFGRNDGPGVTIRSLIHLANQHGAYISLSAELDASAFDDLSTPPPAATPDGPPQRFQFQWLNQFASAPPQPYLIKGILPQAQLAVVFGESASGKTFAVLDMVMAIARGVEWRGRRTRQVNVAYVVAEGAGGLRNRVKAYHDYHGLTLGEVPVAMLEDAPNFLVAKDVKDLIVSLKSMAEFGLVVIDTLAQVTPGGNENAGEDMGKALSHCRQIHKATGATVLLIHHAGKDSSKGARGWSGLRAAADAELEVIRVNSDRAIKVTKAKDDVDGVEFGFTLNTVTLGQDEDGEPITSCVVMATDSVARRTVTSGGAVQKLVLGTLADMVELGSTDVHYDDLVAGVVARLPVEEGKRDQRAVRVKRAIDRCQGEGSLAIFNMRVSFAG